MKQTIACLILATVALSAQGFRKADGNDLSESQIQEIIDKFAANEAQFAKARENYTYRQTVRVLDLDANGRTVGKHEVISDIVFSGDGKRTERVVRAPVPNLQNFQLDPDDEKDLRSVQPFVLTSNDIGKYHVRYLGVEKLDDIPCYAFAVKPKKMEQGQRYFSGIVWVDDRDLQIVKTYGRGVGITKKGHAYPKFETYREQIDGKYWFPTYTLANDVLRFDGSTAFIKMTVKYEDYKQFKADTNIIFGEPVEGAKPDGAKPDGAKPESPKPETKK